MAGSSGVIVQVIGPVLDIRFENGILPNIYNAIKIPTDSGTVTAEVMQHLGNDTVRCVAMSSTDGLVRGMNAEDTGDAITVPVGKEVLGRIFSVLGEPVDKAGPIKPTAYLPYIGKHLLWKNKGLPPKYLRQVLR